MRVKTDEKKRINLWISSIIDERLEMDSQNYGTSKSDIIRVALVDYYRKVDEVAKS